MSDRLQKTSFWDQLSLFFIQRCPVTAQTSHSAQANTSWILMK